MAGGVRWSWPPGPIATMPGLALNRARTKPGANADSVIGFWVAVIPSGPSQWSNTPPPSGQAVYTQVSPTQGQASAWSRADTPHPEADPGPSALSTIPTWPAAQLAPGVGVGLGGDGPAPCRVSTRAAPSVARPARATATLVALGPWCWSATGSTVAAAVPESTRPPSRWRSIIDACNSVPASVSRSAPSV